MNLNSLAAAGELRVSTTRHGIVLTALATIALSGGAAGQVGMVCGEQKISATEGGFSGALLDSDVMGVAAVSLGDLDGDGIGDLAVGATGNDDGFTGAGAVWVLFLNADGSVKGQHEINASSVALGGALLSEDGFGYSVEQVGDLDGDGVVDLAVGAPNLELNSQERGRVFILFMRVDGTVRSSAVIGDGVGGFSTALWPNGNFGSGLCYLGDVNGDGLGELVIGNEDDGAAALKAGSIWVTSLAADGSVASEVRIDPPVGSANFGSDIASLGDIDGDGIGDIMVGAPLSGTGGALSTGSVFILFLNADATVKGVQEIGSGTGGFSTNLSLFGFFGESVEGVGDLDGDGTPDALASHHAGDGGGLQNAGGFFVLLLQPSGRVHTEISINAASGSFGGELDPLDNFGRCLVNLGDRSGDGGLDLAVGSPGDDDGGSSRGAVWLLELFDGDPTPDFTSPRPSVCTGEQMDFLDLSSGAGLSAWQWDFGDGAGSTLQNPSHTYVAAGSYDVSLTVTGAGGTCTTIKRDFAIVLDTLTADFSADQTSGGVPLRVTFNDESLPQPTLWSWDFGDGNTSSAQSPAHTYTAAGTYSVSLTSSCSLGSDMESKTDYIVVIESPACVTSDNGSGLNPDVYTSLSLPGLGTTWMSQADGSGIGATGLALMLGYEGALPPGFMISQGELLVDPTSAFVVSQFGLAIGGVVTFGASVPNDPTLIGFTFSVQSFFLNVPGTSGILTNRLDLKLGTS